MHLPRALAFVTAPYSAGWMQPGNQQPPQGITLPASPYQQHLQYHDHGVRGPMTPTTGSIVDYLPKFTKAEKRAMDQRLREYFPAFEEQEQVVDEEPVAATQAKKDKFVDAPWRSGRRALHGKKHFHQGGATGSTADPLRRSRHLMEDSSASQICSNLANGLTSVRSICDYSIRYPSSASTKTCTKRMDVPDDCAYRQGYNYPCSSGICQGWTCM